MEYFTSMLSPLVTISGVDLPASPDPPILPPPQLVDEVIPLDKKGVTSPVAAGVAKILLNEFSTPWGPWNPKLNKEDRLRFETKNVICMPTKRFKPSILSPKSTAAKSSIFAPEWILKYTHWVTAVSVLFCELPKNENEEAEIIDRLLDLKEALMPYKTQLLVVLVGPGAGLARFVPYLRRHLGGLAKHSVHAIADDLNPQEQMSSAGAIYESCIVLSREYFSAKIAHLREKRQAVSPPLDLLVWDARYTLKMAYCCEFRGDLASAIKLYESTYDSLALLFENKAITMESVPYINARETLDAVATKILQHTLPSKLAFEKLMIHFETVHQIWALNGVDPESSTALFWKGVQYSAFAQLCSSVKQSGMALTAGGDTNPAGTPTGLIWLDAAKLFSSQPSKDAKREDRFSSADLEYTKKEEFTPQFTFIQAISELSGFKRAKAYALTQYGDWLKKSDYSASLQAFRSARQAVPDKLWPEVQKYLSERLEDKLMLFVLGQTAEFPQSLGREQHEDLFLFDALGSFEAPETHIGQEVRAQITLVPKFPGRLRLKTLTINHSLGKITIHDNGAALTGEDEYEHLKILPASTNEAKATLEFNNAVPHTFQISLTSVETGDIELQSIEYTLPSFDLKQTVGVKEGLESWLTGVGKPSPRTRKHLPKTESTSLRVRVNTRPAKLDLQDHTASVAAVGETLKFKFEVKSRESEDISPDITVRLVKRTLEKDQDVELLVRDTKVLKSQGEYVAIEGECAAPASLFELVLMASFDTSADTLPVLFEFKKEIDVVKPFRASFDLVPQHYPQEWPAIFAPSADLPTIARKWVLSLSVLSLFASAPLILHASRINIVCDATEFEIDSSGQNSDDVVMQHNSIKRLYHSFLGTHKYSANSSARKYEAVANVELVWSRQGASSPRNVFKLPPVRLNLPTQEPRVLVVADKKANMAEVSQVTYHIENPTSRILNFSISMSSSTYFAFQGPKTITLRMLPVSTRALTYQLTPLGDVAVQNKRPLPDLRIYDINYKRTLAVLPGDTAITFEQGSLFL